MADVIEHVELVRGPFDGLLVEVAPGSLAVYVTSAKTKCPCCDEEQIQIGYREPGDEAVKMPDHVSIYIPIEQGSCVAGERRRFEVT